jgi:RNA 2',3'-cyclic 3'-phosphodiesterase
MRLFIAIELPDGIRDALARVQSELKAATHSARWVAAESIHITLKFLGEVQEGKIADIHAAVTGLTWKPFTITVRGVGFFPGTRSPRIFWAGMESPTMQELAAQVDSKMEPLGFEKEKRAFRPHITLARAKDTRIDASLVTAATHFKDHDFGSFFVDRMFLFRSTLRPSGAVHEKLREYLL